MRVAPAVPTTRREGWHAYLPGCDRVLGMSLMRGGKTS